MDHTLKTHGRAAKQISETAVPIKLTYFTVSIAYQQICDLPVVGNTIYSPLPGFRKKLISQLKVAEEKKDWGMFIDSCFTHCQTPFKISWNSRVSPRLGNKVRSRSQKSTPQKSCYCLVLGLISSGFLYCRLSQRLLQIGILVEQKK